MPYDTMQYDRDMIRYDNSKIRHSVIIIRYDTIRCEQGSPALLPRAVLPLPHLPVAMPSIAASRSVPLRCRDQRAPEVGRRGSTEKAHDINPNNSNSRQGSKTARKGRQENIWELCFVHRPLRAPFEGCEHFLFKMKL